MNSSGNLLRIDTPIVFPNVPGLGVPGYSEHSQSRHQSVLQQPSSMLSSAYFQQHFADQLPTSLQCEQSALVTLQAFQLAYILGSSDVTCFVEISADKGFVAMAISFAANQSWLEHIADVDQLLASAANNPEQLLTLKAIDELTSDGLLSGPLLFICVGQTMAQQLADTDNKGHGLSGFCHSIYTQTDQNCLLTLQVLNGNLAERQLHQYAQCFEHLVATVAHNPQANASVTQFWNESLIQAFVQQTNPKSFDLNRVNSLPAQLQHCRELLGDKTALVCGTQNLSFEQLATTVEQVAGGLAALGVVAEDKVATYMTRDLDWAVVQLACMSLGAVYTPIDPAYPVSRITHMLTQSEAKFLIVKGELPEALVAAISGVQLHEFASLCKDVAISLSEMTQQLSVEQFAYIQFTSGSTGFPKGALVQHLGMLNHIFAKILDLNIGSHDVIAQTASQCFDVSLWQLLTGLYTQSTTVIYPDEVIWDLDDYMTYTRDNNVTVLEVVPSYLDMLMEEHEFCDEKCFSGLLFLMVTGERVTLGQLSRWFAQYPDIHVINAYGPTEASDDITHFRIDKQFSNPSVPIGHPIHNATIYILDEHQQLVPYGSLGEICVSGVCVGGGYINRPEETARAFVKNTVQPSAPWAMYRTGDLGRWLPDGSVAFLGRNDQQVKVMGVRIELTEIEEAMSAIDTLKDAAVLCIEQCIVAIYSTLSGEPIADATLRKALKEKLPSHSVPSKLIHRTALPLNPNGKVDKNALRKALEAN